MSRINRKAKRVIILVVIVLTFTTGCSDMNMTNTSQQVQLKRDKDTEFVSDSNVRIQSISKIQQKNLFTLAKVWGFAKYRHPDVTGGIVNWDAELFRVMPKVLAAKDRSEANTIMFKWLNRFPFKVKQMSKKDKVQYNTIKKETYIKADISWIKNKNLLGDDLANYLDKLSKVKVSNTVKGYAVFKENENTNLEQDAVTGEIMNYEDSGMRLLSLFRYWNDIEYLYPYKTLSDTDWDDVLYREIPELVRKNDEESYVLKMANLTTYIHDSHASFTDNGKVLQTHFGINVPRVEFLNIDGKIVISKSDISDALKKGDIIISVNGTSVEERIKECRKYISISDKERFAIRFQDYLLSSDSTNADFEVIRDNEEISVKVPCYYNGDTRDYVNQRYSGSDDECGLIADKKVGYINIGTLKIGNLDKFMGKFKDTNGIIVDLRNASSAYIMYALAEYIVPKPEKFIRFGYISSYEPGNIYTGAVNSSGRGYINEEMISALDPMTASAVFENGIARSKLGKVKKRYQYKGKVIVLMNEFTQSKLETTVMSLRNAPKAIVIGTTSTGSNGDIVEINLPGGITTYMSGIAVTYPDGKQTQRIGLQPDVVVEPTVKGIMKGKDELKEKAVDLIIK